MQKYSIVLILPKKNSFLDDIILKQKELNAEWREIMHIMNIPKCVTTSVKKFEG